MNLSDLKDKWLDLVSAANSKGIPLPHIRDPKTGMGSVSLTLVTYSTILVIIGIIGKWSGKLGGIDINSALQFFYASCALYFGRNLSSKQSVLPTNEKSTETNVPVDNPDSPK
jgi:hypothetical protein